jgi:predicted protein tyrosine phosphatase
MIREPRFQNDYLFVCKANLQRSATAEHVARSLGYRADSCGWLEAITVRPLTLASIENAKNIVVMEMMMVQKVKELAPHRNVIVWDIPDRFAYCDPSLIDTIRAKLTR